MIILTTLVVLLYIYGYVGYLYMVRMAIRRAYYAEIIDMVLWPILMVLRGLQSFGEMMTKRADKQVNRHFGK